MKKLLLILIVTFSFFPTISSAQTNSDIQQKIEETKRERDKLLEEQKKLQTALNEVSKEGQTLQTNVKTLDTTRSKLANDLKLTQANINTSLLPTSCAITGMRPLSSHLTSFNQFMHRLSGISDGT